MSVLTNGDLVVGGSFGVAGPSAAHGVARFDGNAWSSLGDGVDNEVYAVAEMPNGDMIVGGRFTTAGGVATGSIARWNGSQWFALGVGLVGDVHDIVVMPNGDVIAAGTCTVPGMGISGIALWDGTGWSPVGGGIQGQVFDMELLSNGDLAIAGLLSIAGGQPVQGLARWNGATWAAIPGLDVGSFHAVKNIAELPSGELALCGTFSIGQQNESLAVTNGTVMQPIASPVGLVNRLTVAANGDLVVVGWYTTPPAPSIARLSGNQWTTLTGDLLNMMDVVEDLAGNIVVAGRATDTEAAVVGFDGSTWQPVGGDVHPVVEDTQARANGDVVVGGLFAAIEGVAANNIASWNGTTWSPLGVGVDGRVTALTEAPDGSLLVGGEFTSAGGAPAGNIARWHNGAWSTLGAGPAEVPTAIAANAAGEIVVLGTSSQFLYHFDGQSWSAVNTAAALGSLSSFHLAVIALPNDDFVVSGWFVIGVGQGYSSFRFSGGAIQLLGPIAGAGKALALSPSGELYGAIRIGNATMLARLVNNTWQPIVAAPPLGTAMEVLPGGDVLYASDYGSTSGLQRWDGVSWQPEAGIQMNNCLDVSLTRHGELFAVGQYELAAGGAGLSFARGTPSCPAQAVAVGAGCTGAAGPLSLVADSLPWLGETTSMTATGLPTQSLAIHAIGTTPVVQPLPLGAPGCSLFVAPIFLDLLTPQNSATTASFFVPNVASLVGQDLRSQVIGLELSPSFALVRTTSTNALELTVGSL